MSSSSIIKLSTLCPEKVLVGSGTSVGRTIPRQPQGFGGRPLAGDGKVGGTVSDAESGLFGWAPGVEEAIAEAKQAAEAILKDVRGEAGEIRERAHEDGFREGHSEGLLMARAESLEDLRRIGDLATNAAVEVGAICRSLEDALVQLALAIAEKIVHKDLAEERSLVVSVVRGALEQIEVMEVLRVRVNPDDHELLKAYWGEGQIGFGGRNIELTADRRVQAGGCVIDANHSVIDAQIETMLAEIKKAFQSESSSRER